MKKLIALLTLMFAFTGCAATQINAARKGVTVGVGVFNAGVQSLDAIDQEVTKDLLGKLDSGALSADEAQAKYDAWLAKYDKAGKAAMVLWDAIKATVAAIDAADAKLKADLPAALANLTAAIANAAQALRDAGVKLPGGL